MSVARMEPRNTLLVATASALVLSLPIALVMSAAAELVIAVAAIPIALVASRDLYVTVLAPSFGVSAAAAVVQWLLTAAPVWALLWPILYSARRIIFIVAGVSGAVAALAGLILSTIVVDHWPGPLAQHTAIAQPSLRNLIIATIAGALAGFVTIWWDRRTHADGAALGWRAATLRSIISMAAYTLALGIALEGAAALLIVFGLT